MQAMIHFSALLAHLYQTYSRFRIATLRFVKRALIGAYCRDLLSARIVAWCFRRLPLKDL